MCARQDAREPGALSRPGVSTRRTINGSEHEGKPTSAAGAAARRSGPLSRLLSLPQSPKSNVLIAFAFPALRSQCFDTFDVLREPLAADLHLDGAESLGEIIVGLLQQLVEGLDLLTIGYAFNAEDTVRLMEEAAPDIFIFHAGITAGGTTGDTGAASLAETAARSERHFALARKIRPDVILLAHGAAIVDPEHAQHMLDHTGCHGIQLGSSVERLAVEGPLEARAVAFKATRLGGGRG